MKNEKEEINFKDRNLFYKLLPVPYNYRPFFYEMNKDDSNFLMCLFGLLMFFPIIITAEFEMFFLSGVLFSASIIMMVFSLIFHIKKEKKIFYKHFTIRRSK